jgi:hypothetical protein
MTQKELELLKSDRDNCEKDWENSKAVTNNLHEDYLKSLDKYKTALKDSNKEKTKQRLKLERTTKKCTNPTCGKDLAINSDNFYSRTHEWVNGKLSIVYMSRCKTCLKSSQLIRDRERKKNILEKTELKKVRNLGYRVNK